MPLKQENSNEDKETSQIVSEEEASRNGAKKSASRRKARQGWVVFKDIREVWSSRAERCLRRSLLNLNMSGYNAIKGRPYTLKIGFRKVQNICDTLMTCIISLEVVILGAVHMYVDLSFLRFSV